MTPFEQFASTVKDILRRIADLERAVRRSADARQGSWTPTLTNVAIGTGGGAGLSADYSYVRGALTIDVAIVLGTSGASVSGAPAISLPPGFTLSRVNTNVKSPLAVAFICGGGYVGGVATHPSSSSIRLLAANTGGTYESRTAITSTVPATWQPGDVMFVLGTVKGTFA